VKNNCRTLALLLWRSVGPRSGVEAGIFAGFALLTAVSAAMVKESQQMPALASVSAAHRSVQVAAPVVGPFVSEVSGAPAGPVEVAEVTPTAREAERGERLLRRASERVRWFNGRPVRPARVVWMKVTAYSPDERSCGVFADGMTATLHPVETNGGYLVAADTRLFPFGSMLSVEGYAGGDIVPVLDRGGAIKGHHIDLLMPTHAQAMRWGVKRMPVVVWEFADGGPLEDPRKFR
jgi:3D (Asp-Asp-Asp) domain-containing protein